VSARVSIWLVGLALLGCSEGTPPATSEPPPSEPADEEAPADEEGADDEAPASATDAAGAFVDDAALGARGWSVAERAGAPVVCAGSSCVCREALPYETTFEENLRVFRAALDEGQGDRQVTCLSGVVGSCGAFRFFLFVGDIYRHEVRWFDADGALVGVRNVTDYDAYCGGSLARFAGQIPRCDAVEVDEVICGEPQPVLPPLDDLARLLQGHGPEGSGP